MADFVAVIRRAVDGLANNTPEMRVRVYDKARSAVQRQLENMKPRPSDDMLRRQLDKLEAAIVEVEAEHAEAMPALAVPVAAASLAPEVYEPEPPQAPEPEPVAREQQVYAEETYAEPSAAVEQEPSAYAEPEPLAPQPAYAAPYDSAELPVTEDAPAVEAVPEPEPLSAIPDYAEPAEEAPLYAEPAYEEPQPVAAAYAEPEYHNPEPEPQADRYSDEPRYAARAPAPAWPDAPSTAPVVDVDPFADDLPSAAYPADVEPERPAAAATNAVPDDWFMASDDVERVTHDPVHFSESLRRTQELQPELPSAGDWAEPPQTSTASSVSSHDDAAADIFSAHFDHEQHAPATAKMPPVADLPEFQAAPPAARPSSFAADDDLLAEFLKPSQAAQQVAPPPAAAADPWNDLEELIGYDRNAATAAGSGAAVLAAGAAANVPGDAAAQASRLPEDELDDLMAAATPSYRVAPKPKRNYGVLLLALVGVALLGGGGYAIWMNRDALDDVIGDVAGSSAPQTTAPATSAVTPAGMQPAAGAAGNAQAPAGTSTPATPAAGSSKFTQRLLANGSEVDEGAGGPQVAGTGQSVAQLNVPGDMSQAPAQGQAPAQAGTPAMGAAPGTAPAAPAANPAATAAVTGEKIFLYEERIGQSSPAAVEGSVSWSLQNEAGANGRAEPVVQGRISVPDRGLTALITFKRNSDASLPASHLVEFVFSLPPGFEGGAIDSVQRISLKQTEQDRGDALIAVPAKITPDFHMIALNDFPDARSRNMELLKGRNWIDVPLVYTTGRRALLTLQKGQAGAKAFNDAITQWAALPPTPGQ
ncbi:hypothetical protein [Rhizobium sp. FY34]|uniref:hypothetical protein n=1 Tax=Rhizobium sp. FY34 TaxID=2562309 RepID=UPI0010C0F1BB|nr:hypothetical protein [Rhizobium sp. FY34]